jgi:hypothetical protein
MDQIGAGRKCEKESYDPKYSEKEEKRQMCLIIFIASPQLNSSYHHFLTSQSNEYSPCRCR